MGYLAELQLEKAIKKVKGVTKVTKPKDHDRAFKYDKLVIYKKAPVSIEAKSLQSHTVKPLPSGGFSAKFQCDASDRRTVTLPNGNTVDTTCLLAGEFDILAVNLFAMLDRWEFAYIKNKDLPKSTYRKYTEEDREHLLAGTVDIVWPLEAPYTNDLKSLMDECAVKPP